MPAASAPVPRDSPPGAWPRSRRFCRPRLLLALLLLAAAGTGGAWSAPLRQMEWLDRGLVALPGEGGTVLSWRSLASDPPGLAFEVHREIGDRSECLTPDPLEGPTFWIDRSSPSEGQDVAYRLVPVAEGRRGAPGAPVRPWPRPWLEIPLQVLPDYRPGDCSVGDLDGDGAYELIVHQVSRPRDNSHAGLTGRPILDAYELDGTHLWRIDLGINIREGEHYTQFMVYDLDGDGRAEMVCKTADGTVDGRGKIIGDPDRDWRVLDPDDRRHGRVLSGPEYLTVFDGRSGAALSTIDYLPARDPIDGWGGIGGNGGNDAYGNRCDRFLACVAFLDGERPSVVMCRGVYGRTVLVAWDWRGGRLTRRWTFDSGTSMPPFDDASPYSGMGGHSLSVADVDADGRDEIVYQAMTIDDDGTGLYSTGRRHGDAMHLGDFDPRRPGLELFLVTENEGATVRLGTPGVGMHDAATGRPLWTHSPGVDVRGGLVADIDPRHPGAEAWGGPGGLRSVDGREIGPAPRSDDFAIWWDGDLLRELLSGGRTVRRWDWEEGREHTLLDAAHGGGRRRGGWRPRLVADILGDWREELLVTGPEGRSLRLHISPLPTTHRLTTLVHDPQYRLGIAWQNVVYNKPAHPGFHLGADMEPPPRRAFHFPRYGAERP